MGVSPLRGAGLLRCAASRRQRPSVSPLRAAIPHAGSPVRSPMQRSRLRLLRDAEPPGEAGDDGRDDDSGPFPCPGIAGLGSFTGT